MYNLCFSLLKNLLISKIVRDKRGRWIFCNISINWLSLLMGHYIPIGGKWTILILVCRKRSLRDRASCLRLSQIDLLIQLRVCCHINEIIIWPHLSLFIVKWVQHLHITERDLKLFSWKMIWGILGSLVHSCVLIRHQFWIFYIFQVVLSKFHQGWYSNISFTLGHSLRIHQNLIEAVVRNWSKITNLIVYHAL